MSLELNHDHLTRQLDLIPIDVLSVPITIIGCGAIGSFAALSLVKMGFTQLELWDEDEVSIENMSNQFFRFKDIGTNKAQALAALIKDFTNVDVKFIPSYFSLELGGQRRGHTVSAVDCMDARAMILESLRASTRSGMLIDPRMAAEHATLYTINPFEAKDLESYRKTLFKNDEAVAERCTAKSTIYTVNLMAGLIAKTIKNIACKQDYIRTLQWDLKGSTNNYIQMHCNNA